VLVSGEPLQNVHGHLELQHLEGTEENLLMCTGKISKSKSAPAIRCLGGKESERGPSQGW